MYLQKLLAGDAGARALAVHANFQYHVRSLGPLRPRGRGHRQTDGHSSERLLVHLRRGYSPADPTPLEASGQGRHASRRRLFSGRRRVHGRHPSEESAFTLFDISAT